MKKTILILFIIFIGANVYSQQEEKEKITDKAKTINEEKKFLTQREKIIEELKKWDERLSSLKSDFKQEVFFKEANIKQNVEGNILYKKPNNLRIEHTHPSKQIILTNKVDIQIYKVEDDQIYKMSWDYWKKNQNFSQILDFGNYSEIIDKNDINVTTSSTSIKVEFINKENPSLYIFILFLSPENFFPYQSTLQVEDTFITTKLLNTEINAKIEDKVFKLEKNKKTETIEIKSK